MNLNVEKSALLKTSAKTDVKMSGGLVKITGLNDIKLSNLVDVKQLMYKAEVVQVATALDFSYTPVGGITYGVTLTSPAFSKSGNRMNTERRYRIKTPDTITDLGATAAIQRENIHAQLVTLINADPTNFVTAVTVGSGNGITVTDEAGYYPARLNGASNGREGATGVLNTRSAGSSSWQNEATVTTAAVYEFGVGTRLAQDTPIFANYIAGNLVSGEYDAPVAADGTYAVGGQKYDAFAVSSLVLHDIPTITATVRGFKVFDQIVFVDNGTGSSTTNLAGYKAFVREMLRVVFSMYESDFSSFVNFFDSGFTYATLTGLSVIPTTALAENTINFGDGFAMSFTPLVTATAAANAMPIYDSTNGGMNLANDAASGKGMEVSAPLSTFSAKQFIVGQGEFSLYARVYIDDVSGTSPLLFGFRKKEAYTATPGNYTDFAALGIISPTGTTEFIKTYTNLASAGATTTTSTATFADTETHDLEVRVNGSGKVSWFVDGVQINVSTSFTFAANTVLIPYYYEKQSSDVAANVTILQTAVIPTASWRI